MPNEPMTEERLVEIRGREKAATQGPWRVKSKIIEADECGNVTFATTYVSTNDKAICFVYGRGHDDVNEREDAAFLAHAREDIPALLDEVERLRAELENADKRTKFWIYFSALLSGGKSDIGGKLNTSMSFSDLPEMSKEELFK